MIRFRVDYCEAGEWRASREAAVKCSALYDGWGTFPTREDAQVFIDGCKYQSLTKERKYRIVDVDTSKR